MESNRLVAFGCSLTFGSNLDDIHPDNNTPSKLAWPQALGDLAGIPVDNQAKPGASNKEILYNILKYDFSPTDIVVVCWTYLGRWCIVTKDLLFKIGPWYTEHKDAYVQFNKSDAFYKHIYDEHDMWLEFNNNIMLADLYLESKNIKHYSLLHSFSSDSPTHSNILDIDYAKIRKNNPVTLDGHHPGEQAHRLLAQELYRYTTKNEG